jgi:hypothetical protein
MKGTALEDTKVAEEKAARVNARGVAYPEGFVCP